MYLDSEDPFYSVKSNPVQPSKPTKKKDDSIITKKILILFGIVAVVKICVLLLWI